MSATGDVLRLVNAARRDQGLHPLAGDEKLAKAALRRATKLARRGRLDEHTGWLAALTAVRYPWRRREVGENIAVGQPSPVEVVRDWMASPGHRENILRPAYRRLGVGVAEGFGSRFWVQEFSS